MKFEKEKECFALAEGFVKSIPDSIDLLQSIRDYLISEVEEIDEESIAHIYELVKTVLHRDFHKDLKPAEWYCARCGVKRVKYGLNCKECSELIKSKQNVTPDIGIAAIANKDTENDGSEKVGM